MVCDHVTCFCRIVPDVMTNKQNYPARVFLSNFSHDGSVYLVGTQDANLRIYPFVPGATKESKPSQTIRCRDISWSILDTVFSPDSRFVAYSSWSPYVRLCNLISPREMAEKKGQAHELHENLKFSDESDRIAFFSIAYSPDGREIVGGCNGGTVYVYDVERKECVFQFDGHQDDVNAVRFFDNNLIISGSDDCLVKVWDRRMLSSFATPTVSSVTRRESDLADCCVASRPVDSLDTARALLLSTAEETMFIC